MNRPSLVSAGLFLLLAGCASTVEKPVGLANPAAVYCADIGGRSEIRTAADGGQSGFCKLPDGRVVDEWELFRSAHPRTPS